MDLNEFLLWLASSAGSSAVASFILERITKYQSLAADVKQWVFFGVCLVLSVTSYLVLTYVPVEVLEAVKPYFGLIASTFISVFLGTAFHKLDKTNKNVG